MQNDLSIYRGKTFGMLKNCNKKPYLIGSSYTLPRQPHSMNRSVRIQGTTNIEMTVNNNLDRWFLYAITKYILLISYSRMRRHVIFWCAEEGRGKYSYCLPTFFSYLDILQDQRLKQKHELRG